MPQLNDQQKKFLLVQRLSIVWKVCALIAVALAIYFVMTGGL